MADYARMNQLLFEGDKESVPRLTEEALAEGPVLIQVFRAGFSTGLACAECGERGVCGACHGPLRLMAQGVRPHCSWCGVPDTAWRCEACQGKNLVPRGQGIGRTVSDIGTAFPTVPVFGPTARIGSCGSHRNPHW